MWMRFIATADLQIGMTLSQFGAQQAAFDQARLETLTTLARLVRETAADAVVVAGDLFDREEVASADLRRTLKAIAGIGVPVLVLPGNHDAHAPRSVWTSKAFGDERPDNLILLLDQVHDVAGVEVVGAPLMTRHPDTPTLHDRLDTLPADGRARVVVGHGAVIEIVGDHGSPAAFSDVAIDAALTDGRASCVVLGDRHSFHPVGATDRAWYPGSPEPTDFADDEGHVLIVDVDADTGAVAYEQRRTGTWTFAAHAPELTGPDDVATLLATLDAYDAPQRTVVRLRPIGVLDLPTRQALEVGIAAARDLLAVLEVDLAGVRVRLDPATVEGLPLAPYVRGVLDALGAAAQQGDEEAQAELDLLLALVTAEVA
jgi:DNA repair exonuclease SbcCD nuclease subunit